MYKIVHMYKIKHIMYKIKHIFIKLFEMIAVSVY